MDGFRIIRKTKHLYATWSWQGVWTWGAGVDRFGIGLYLGPFSGWLIWNHNTQNAMPLAVRQ